MWFLCPLPVKLSLDLYSPHTLQLMFFLCHTDSFGFAGAKVRNYWQTNEYPIGFIGKGLTSPWEAIFGMAEVSAMPKIATYGCMPARKQVAQIRGNIVDQSEIGTMFSGTCAPRFLSCSLMRWLSRITPLSDLPKVWLWKRLLPPEAVNRRADDIFGLFGE